MAKKKTKSEMDEKKPSKKITKTAAKQLHLKGLEALAALAVGFRSPPAPPAPPTFLAAFPAGGAPHGGNMSPGEAVIWALNRAVGPPFGPGDSVSGLGITSNVQWESLANDLHTARNSYHLNGAQTRAKLPAAPGDTVAALVGVVSGNS